MRCLCALYLAILCTMMLVTLCVSKPTVQPNDTISYDDLNITYVSTGYNTNSSTGNDQPLVKLDNIGIENTSAINVTENGQKVLNDTEHDTKNHDGKQNQQSSEIFTPAKKELPMGMIIAGPAAALGIMIFLCFSYYCHNLQLNNQAKRLSMALYVTPDDSTDSTNEATAVPIIQGPQPPRIHKQSTASLTVPSRISRENSDLYSTRRKSTLTVPSISVPGNLNHKRGSSWSALADQEILNLTAPRRHSTFIL